MRFGRVAVAGTKVRSWTGYGNRPAPDGTVHIFKGPRRVLQVAHDQPRYFTRDMLEDFDMFGEHPGYQYQWDGVEIEANVLEVAADQVEVDAKAEQARLKTEAADRAKAVQDEQRRVWEQAIAGLEQSTVGPKDAIVTDERLTLGEKLNGVKLAPDEKSYGTRLTLSDGRTAWRSEWFGYDHYRVYYYLPADVARAARLAYAEASGITPERAAEWLKKYSGCYGADLFREVASANP